MLPKHYVALERENISLQRHIQRKLPQREVDDQVFL
jgi:hypothetical protein